MFLLFFTLLCSTNSDNVKATITGEEGNGSNLNTTNEQQVQEKAKNANLGLDSPNFFEHISEDTFFADLWKKDEDAFEEKQIFTTNLSSEIDETFSQIPSCRILCFTIKSRFLSLQSQI